jgi:predicted GNAT family N-acyltransferase
MLETDNQQSDRIVPDHGAPWHVSAFMVPQDDPDQANLVLGLVRGLRARILFDRGRRPAFRRSDGTHFDDQDLDYGAWHFLARREPDGPPLGYVRLSTPATGQMFQSRAYLGERYEQVLRTHGFRVQDTFEYGRLVVEHRARKLGLGIYLSALAVGAAQHLGAKSIIGTSGTKDDQHRFHERFGFYGLPETRRYVDEYTEDVIVMCGPADGAGEFTDLVAQLRAQFPTLAAAGLAELPKPTERQPPAPAGLRGRVNRTDWRPTLFQPTHTPDRAALTTLLDSGDIREVHDTVDSQLTELIRSREPAESFDDAQLQTKKDEQLAGVDMWAYGAWAWYPWSRRLVHVLPREEFRMVRTDRNREKIPRPDQRRLLNQRIGIIGLSVGNSVAVTFALEGIGGAYKLADFDECSLSNLNRLRCGVQDLGVNKAVIAARQMFEIDPYLDIEVYTDGLTDANMTKFFTGGSGPIDLLVEECDTPYVKIAARERARALGLAVLMDCNDRGMLDIERFDLEPTRPLLHGLIGDRNADDVRNLDRQAAVDLILAMVDAERISTELAAAIPELGKTLSSWPQLASGVALGGALTAEVARRILLGRPCGSGRFYVDLATLITPEYNSITMRQTQTIR